MIRTIATTFTTLAITTQCIADSIALRTNVTIPPNVRAITLGDIAELQGEHAERLADVVLQNVTQNIPMTITIDQVREALDAAGAHWGLIDLNGRTTDVQMASQLAGAPQAMVGFSINASVQSATIHPEKDESISADALLRQRTAAGVLALTVARQLRLDPAKIRLTFDPKDRQFLDLPMAQYRFEVLPMSSLVSDHVSMQVRAWRDGSITHRRTIEFDVEVHVHAPLAGRDLRRGDALIAGDVQSMTQWIGAGVLRELASAEELAGRIATASMKQGELIRLRDVKRKTLIERGDIVQVRCLVGGVALTMQAEARTDGSQGDTIEFRKLGERDTFLAKVTNRNEAIVDLARNN